MVKLPSFIQSHEQLGLYVMQIDRYRSYILQKSAGGPAEEPTISAKLKEYLFEISEGKEITMDALGELHNFLKNLKDKAPRFSVTLATFADDEIKKDIVSWFRDNVHKHSLVAFYYDRSIAGGIIVRGRNNIFNFSFAPKLKNPTRQLTEFINGQ